jgi:serine/threonine-protein kinase HipA
LLNLGYQAMAVGRAGAESSLDNALSDINEFGLTRARAIELIQEVAHTVSQWQAHFIACGVSAADVELLAASIDRPALKLQRQEFS